MILWHFDDLFIRIEQVIVVRVVLLVVKVLLRSTLRNRNNCHRIIIYPIDTVHWP